MLMTIVGVLVGLLILGVIIVGVYISIQGDAVMRLLVKQRTKAVLDKVYADRIDFSLEVPFDNVGKQEGTILDAYMRIYLPQEQYSDVLLRGKVNREGYLREDDYFVLRFEAYAKNGKSLEEAMENIPDVDVALFADCRGRRELYTVKEYFTLTADEMRALVK